MIIIQDKTITLDDFDFFNSLLKPHKSPLVVIIAMIYGVKIR